MVHEIRHVAPIKIAEDVIIREAQGFMEPEFTNGELTLSEAEITFFKENGFIVKCGFLEEREAFKRIVDYVWENVPRGLFRRDDPKSWIGTPSDQWTEEDELQV